MDLDGVAQGRACAFAFGKHLILQSAFSHGDLFAGGVFGHEGGGFSGLFGGGFGLNALGIGLDHGLGFLRGHLRLAAVIPGLEPRNQGRAVKFDLVELRAELRAHQQPQRIADLLVFAVQRHRISGHQGCGQSKVKRQRECGRAKHVHT